MNRLIRIPITTIAFLASLVVSIQGAADTQLMLFGREIYEGHTAMFAVLWAISFIVGTAVAYCVAYTLAKSLPRISN